MTHPCFSHLPRWRLTSRLKLFFSNATRDALNGLRRHRGERRRTCRRRTTAWDDVSRRAVPRDDAISCPATSCRRKAIAWRWRTASKAASVPRSRHRLVRIAPPRQPETPAPGREIPAQAFSVERRAGTGAAPRQAAVSGTGRQVVLRSARWRLRETICCRPISFGATGFSIRAAVELLVRKYRAGRARCREDDMALVAILSTQIVLDRFVNHFEVSHGALYRGTARVHHG